MFIEKIGLDPSVFSRLYNAVNLLETAKNFNTIIACMTMGKKDFSVLQNSLDKLIGKSIKKRAFPGAALGFCSFQRSKIIKDIYCYGSVDGSSKPVDADTFYDLASLTKPLATVLCLLSLVHQKKVDLEAKLSDLLPFVVPEDKKDIRIFHLLSHCSGLPAHRPYYQLLENIPLSSRKKDITQLILKEDLINIPGQESLYSDLGFILLGYIVEEASGQSLDEFWYKVVANPFSLQKSICFSKGNDWISSNLALTFSGSLKKKETLVRVHDDNCRILGGVAGHAGLFGTVDGVLTLCEKLLLQWKNLSNHPFYANEELERFLKREKNKRWTLGFDTPSAVDSSSGSYFSNKTVGHLGFTGTSFWIDYNKQTIIVFLTNRVYWNNDTEMIRSIRPQVHDLIMGALAGS